MSNLRFQSRQLLAVAMIVPLLAVASCAGSNQEQASKTVTETTTGPAESDSVNDAEDNSDEADTGEDADEQAVCNLLSNEEIGKVTGSEVLTAVGSTMGLPMCEWELTVPGSSEITEAPLLSLVLLPAADYHSRVDPLVSSLKDVAGPADELKLHFVGGGDTGIPTMVTFFTLNGENGFQIMSSPNMWPDEATATTALLDLTEKILERT